MANPFAQHSSSASALSPFANPPDRAASKSPFSTQPAFAKPAVTDTSGPVKNPFTQPAPTPSPFDAPSLNGTANTNGNGLSNHAATKPPAFGAPSKPSPFGQPPTAKNGFTNGDNNKKKRMTPSRGTSPQPPKPPPSVRATSDYAKRIYAQLKKDKIFRPKWPPNYGSPSQRAAMDDFHQEHKKYRDAARKSLIKSGLIDDPEKQKGLHDAIAFKGICEEMCPEFEKIKRIVQHDVKQAEKVDGIPVHEKMIKALARSAAGQEAPLPMDVLSIGSCRRTVDYLIDQVLRSDSNLSVMHGFLWDRTRAIRRDFVFHSTTTDDEKRDQIYVLETIVRFHVVALHLMSQKGFAGDDFSEKQEVEQLSKALLSLLELYKKCRQEKSKVVPPNEAEFVAYSILLYARDPSNLSRVYPWGKDLYDKSDDIRTAIAIVEAIQNTWDFQGPEIGNPDSLTPFTTALPAFSLIFSILEDPHVSYTMACFAEILFVHVRQSMLKVINSSYWRPRTDVNDWTTKKLRRILRFDTEEEVVEFVKAHGIDISTNKNGEDYMILVQKGDISFPKVPQSFSRSLVEKKRCGRPLPQVIREAVYDTSVHSPVESDEDSLFVTDKPLPKLSQVKPPTPFGPAQTIGDEPESNPFSMLNQPPSFLNPATGSLSPPTTQLEPPKPAPTQKISDPPRDPGAPPKAPVPAHAQLPGKAAPFSNPPSASPQTQFFTPQVEVTPPSPGEAKTTATNAAAFAAPTAPASGSSRATDNGLGGITNTVSGPPLSSWAHAPANNPSASVQPAVGALGPNSPTSATAGATTPPILTPSNSSAPAAATPSIFSSSSSGATSQTMPGSNAPATNPPFLFTAPQPSQATPSGTRSPSILGGTSQPPVAAAGGVTGILKKGPDGLPAPAAQATKPAVNPMFQKQQDAISTFVPLGVPTVPANQLSKVDVVRGVSKWYMMGDNGLLDQFIHTTVEDLVYEAFEQYRQEVEAEKERQELAEDIRIAEEFRATKLVQRYGLYWKHIAAKMGSRRRRAENQAKLQTWREEKAAQARREREIQEAKARRRPGLMDEFRKVVRNQQSQMDKLAIEQAIMNTGLLSGVHDQEKAAKRVASDGGWSDNSGGNGSEVSSSHPAKKAKTGRGGSSSLLRHNMFSQSLTNLLDPESRRHTPTVDDDSMSERSVRSGISSILNMPHKARSKTARILEELRTGHKNLLNGGFRRSLPPLTLTRSLSNSTTGTGTAEPEQRHRSMVKDPYWKFKRWGMDLLPNGQAVPAEIGREIRQGKVYERLGHVRFETTGGAKRRHGDYESEEAGGEEVPGQGQGAKKARTVTAAKSYSVATEKEKEKGTSKDERLERLKLSDPETYEIVMASRRTAMALDEATEAIREVNSRDSHGVFWE